MIILVKRIPEDLSGIILRDADEAECMAGGMTGQEAIRKSANESIFSAMVEVDGEPAAFWGFGAVSPFSYRSYAWLLTTPAVERCRFALGRESRRAVASLTERFPEVLVEVHREHVTAYNWLRWLGFHFSEERGEFLQMLLRRA